MTLDEYIQNRAKKDPVFKEEYEALQPEYEIQMAIIHARMEAGITQKQLSEKTGITQGDISRMENGTYNPSIRTLKRLASGMNMRLKIEFIAAGGE